jgi:hypothetical protein
MAYLVQTRSVGAPPPTFEELRSALGGSATNLRHHLDWLAEHGCIRVESTPREVPRQTIVLVGGAS